MVQFIITTVLVFGGILLYIINQSIFKTFKLNHATGVLLFLGSLIPVAGLLIQICYTIWASNNYQAMDFYSKGNVQIRNSMLNRWLFNDINWDDYDKWKKHDECAKQNNKKD